MSVGCEMSELIKFTLGLRSLFLSFTLDSPSVISAAFPCSANHWELPVKAFVKLINESTKNEFNVKIPSMQIQWIPFDDGSQPRLRLT